MAKSKQPSKSRLNKLKWANISKELREQFPLCEYCRKTPSTQVHHLVSKFFMKSLLRFDKRNLVCLCGKCHFVFHKNPISTMDWLRLGRFFDYKYLLETLEQVNQRHY